MKDGLVITHIHSMDWFEKYSGYPQPFLLTNLLLRSKISLTE